MPARRLATLAACLALTAFLATTALGCSADGNTTASQSTEQQHTEIVHSNSLVGTWCISASTLSGESRLAVTPVYDESNIIEFTNEKSASMTLNGKDRSFIVSESNGSYLLTSTDGTTKFYAALTQREGSERDTLVVSSAYDSNKRMIAFRYDGDIEAGSATVSIGYLDASSSTSTGGDDSYETYVKDGESQNSSNTDSGSTTLGKQNALAMAKRYLESMAFSKSRLAEQLEYEGFSSSEANYAVENCGADWNEQAARKAQEYLDSMPFSRSKLIEQLEYEGFTSSQAEYGVSAVWN